MRSKIIFSLVLAAITVVFACSKTSKKNGSPQPPNKISKDSESDSVQDLLTASRSGDKNTRLNALKGLEGALKTANQNDLMSIGTRLAEMAQQDPDQDVRNEAARILSSGNSGKDSEDQNSPNSNSSDNASGEKADDGSATGTFYGAVIKCVKSAQTTSYPALPATYSVGCSPVLTGSNYQDLQSKLSQWQASNCPSPLLVDEANSFIGTDGKTYIPHLMPANVKQSSSTNKDAVEKAISSGTCSAISGTNYGSWVPKLKD